MTTTSAEGATSWTRSRSCAAEVTGIVRAPATSGSATFAATTVTEAPRATAALATAYP